MLKPLKLNPTYKDYVWGGNRLRSEEEITAEAWVVYEKNKVTTGPYTGKTLKEVASL
jgi:mannose-6-phosphate isomerase class I